MRKVVCTTALLILMAAPAVAHHKDDHSNGQPTHGCAQAQENDGDPYDSTCDGETSTRGGHVDGSKGAADNKNPQGQMPNGSDDNNGYECDGNNGHPNPAHTGCASVPPPPPPTPRPTPTPPCRSCPKPTPTPTLPPPHIIVCKDCPRLPETGSGLIPLALGGLALLGTGIALSKR